jgi:hypothetical protein
LGFYNSLAQVTDGKTSFALSSYQYDINSLSPCLNELLTQQGFPLVEQSSLASNWVRIPPAYRAPDRPLIFAIVRPTRAV